MSAIVVVSLLAAALLHATWNAILRSGADRLWSVTMMCVIGALFAVPFAIALAPPAASSWSYLGASAVLQTGYCLFLVRAYRDGELAHVYPIARGTAPLLVTVGAALFAGESVGVAGALGVILISGGILTLGSGRTQPDRRSTFAAVASGCFIASYMVTDGIGVRLAEHAAAYAAWQAAATGVTMPLVYLAIRRRLPARPRGRSGAMVGVAAIFGVVGYGVAIWAMNRAPMGQVSALRETSILFAAVIGAVALHEPVTIRRAIGGVAVAAGAIALAVHG